MKHKQEAGSRKQEAAPSTTLQEIIWCHRFRLSSQLLSKWMAHEQGVFVMVLTCLSAFVCLYLCLRVPLTLTHLQPLPACFPPPPRPFPTYIWGCLEDEKGWLLCFVELHHRSHVAAPENKSEGQGERGGGRNRERQREVTVSATATACSKHTHTHTQTHTYTHTRTHARTHA